MVEPQRPAVCPDCDSTPALTRRQVLQVAGGVAVAAVTAGLPIVVRPRPTVAAPRPTSKSETLVAQLYSSLTEEQKRMICFPFDHALRGEVDNNWYITRARVGQHFNADQQALIAEIFQKLHNPDFVERRMKQIHEDTNGRGLAATSIAIFGEPGSGKFEFVLTGRHCTVRCDGDSVEGAAFGGPIFYGHASISGFNETKDHPGNVYWYQALRANEVFRALDGRQRAQALISGPVPPEIRTDTVKLRGRNGNFPGIPVRTMTRDQRELVKKVLADLLLPFRSEDVEEAMRHIETNGGIESLHMAFYSSEDIGNDQVWDVWRLEGPTMVWYFRGSPHVHTWVNIRASA